MKNFTLNQKNNLLTGNTLVAELSNTNEGKRTFVVVRAYMDNQPFGGRVSKFPDKSEEEMKNIAFAYRKYSIDNYYIENDLDVSKDELVDEIAKNGIKSFEVLEEIIQQYVDDFSLFDLEWKFDNPI
ncbi:hypothetical protein [Fulvivirga sp.]|uniref:hypothetical protein n=1 Tax=Fulvivirga sp. TaxID=1931237 RepID=UPI0032EC3C38